MENGILMRRVPSNSEDSPGESSGMMRAIDPSGYGAFDAICQSRDDVSKSPLRARATG
jgi:hypothetical protein